jgi:amino acid transporter
MTETAAATAESEPAVASPADAASATASASASAPSGATPAAALNFDLPESLSYRLKKKFLGPPLVTERLSEEKLSKRVALGVLAPDMISSSAYGTEQILNQLVPFIGVAAFSLLLPITYTILVVLIFVTLSYREVVMVYTKAGGSYVVSRDNFGPRIAQVAAVALIIDYILTVAVQVAAGSEVLASAFPALSNHHLPLIISLAVVLLMTWGNLRGIREAGRLFALPTYLFVTGVGSVVIFGVIRAALGQLHPHPIPPPDVLGYTPGQPGNGLLMGATLLIVLRAFANGGASLTGLEAISNGVANFRDPRGRNARRVLVIMSTILGILVLGVSVIAHFTHAVPYASGIPTVLSQEITFVFGTDPVGRALFYYVEFVTILILWTGGNTSFNGFPNLASFVAEDAYLPRRLMRRGHRLAFSNGIIILAVLSSALLVGTDAQVSALVAMYAIGVFVGFTMAGSGMVKHHFTYREKGWRAKSVINGFAAVLSALIVLILAVVKFSQGAWLVVVLFPILVTILIRLHRQYENEQQELAENAARACVAPVLRRHVVLLFVERLDLATARAIQVGRSLNPTELRAVHFVLDTAAADELRDQWTQLGLSRLPLDLVECPDRRLVRAVMELVAETAADGETEVGVLLPRRVFEGVFRFVLHDRTSDRIAGLVSQLPNANATIVPFPLGKRRKDLVPWKVGGGRGVDSVRDSLRISPHGHPDRRKGGASAERAVATATATAASSLDSWRALYPDTVTIGSIETRRRARVIGRVKSVRVQPGSSLTSVECTIADGSGQLVLLFQGRRSVPGIGTGTYLLVEGMVGKRSGRPAMINPIYLILAAPEKPDGGGRG